MEYANKESMVASAVEKVTHLIQLSADAVDEGHLHGWDLVLLLPVHQVLGNAR